MINIITLKSIYEQYVATGLIEQLPTFQLSQDPLESLFSRVRSLNGNSENPPVSQFTSAFRKILLNNEITSSVAANCVDNLKILSVSSRNHRRQSQENIFAILLDANPQQTEDEMESFRLITLNENDFLMDCAEEITIASIATSIEQKIQTSGRFQCECQFVLSRNEKVVDLTISNEAAAPCISTMYACKVANACFNMCKNHINLDFEALIEKVMDILDFDSIFVNFFTCESSHKRGFIEYMVREFVRLQATYIAKNLTLIEHKVMCRNVLKKKIHFFGQ